MTDDRPVHRTRLLTARPVAALAVTALLLPGAVGAVDRFDCLADDPACPRVMIDGDPWAVLPDGPPSPFRGYGDPSIRKDPASDRLWLTYSYLSYLAGPGDPPPVQGTVSVHLASSDDGGATWQRQRRLWPAETETDVAPPGGLGVSTHEVSSLAPLDADSLRWFGMEFRYFKPFGAEGRRPNSMHFRLARAKRPSALGNRPHSRIGGPLTDEAWRLDLNLSTMDPELARCQIWTEPSLFGLDGQIYLVAQCLVLQPFTGERLEDEEFIGVFVSDGKGPIAELDWRWLGKLSDRADADALGGDVLTQAEVTTSRDGSLLLLVTPKRLRPVERHRGCRALELESLDPPRLKRNAAGPPIVRADLRSSDSTGLGPGLCSYDPASETGILFVRTEIDLAKPEAIFSLHETGIHP